ncbi:tryptophan tryptophylquinone biosynthesis enzyme MauG, partial [Rhizobium ruizarguesonis]
MRFLIAASLIALAVVQPGAAADLSAYKRPLTVPFEGVTVYSPQLATLGK